MEEKVYAIKAYPADQAYFSLTLDEKDYEKFGKMSTEEKQLFITENSQIQNNPSKQSEISYYTSARVCRDNLG